MQKIHWLILFFISFLLVSCEPPTNPCALSKEVLHDIHTLDSLTNLPELRQRDKDRMENNYQEPSLLNAKVETYRFIWSSSFDTTKIDRIEKMDGHYRVTRKIFANHQDRIGTISKFEITESEWNHIVNGLAENNFWTYPTSDNRNGLDGATWIMEGYKPIKDTCTLKNYHRIGRWSPVDTTFIKMCDLLYKLRKH